MQHTINVEKHFRCQGPTLLPVADHQTSTPLPGLCTASCDRLWWGRGPAGHTMHASGRRQATVPRPDGQARSALVQRGAVMHAVQCGTLIQRNRCARPVHGGSCPRVVGQSRQLSSQAASLKSQPRSAVLFSCVCSPSTRRQPVRARFISTGRPVCAACCAAVRRLKSVACQDGVGWGRRGSGAMHACMHGGPGGRRPRQALRARRVCNAFRRRVTSW